MQAPYEAEQGAVPRSAIAAGADVVLPIRQLAAQFLELVRSKANVNARSLEQTASSDDLVRRILGLLRAKTGQDFSRYKRATVMRRLARRMQVAQTEDLEATSLFRAASTGIGKRTGRGPGISGMRAALSARGSIGSMSRDRSTAR